MTEPNPFADFFADENVSMVGPIIVSDEDDGTIFSDAIEEQFNLAMAELADQVPDDDEDAANTLMAEAVQSLMVRCFRAGMLFQNEITSEPQSASPDGVINVGIDPQEASEIITNLLGNGATLRLVVERGQN